MSNEQQIFTGSWYPWYPEKALTSEVIDGLSLAEEGAYRRALDKAWLNGSLPGDPKEAAKVIGNGCTAKIAERVLAVTLFRPMRGNRKRVIHTVIERIRAEQKEKHEKRVEAGSKRRAAKSNGFNGQTSNATAIQQHRYTDKEEEEDIDKEKKKEAAAVAASKPAAAIDPVEQRIWRDGVELLGRSDMPESKSRSLLGGWARDYGRVALAQAIAVTMAVNSPDPKSYIGGVLKGLRKDRASMLVGKEGPASSDQARAYACGECFDTGRVVRPAKDGEVNVGGMVFDDCGCRSVL